MIEARGPDNLLVVERNGVLVRDVVSAMITYNTISDVCNKFPLSEQEIYECCDAFLDNVRESYDDYIQFHIVITDDDTMDMETIRLTDWVFLSCLMYGRMFIQTDDITHTYTVGLASILRDCLADIVTSSDHCEVSRVHELVLAGFQDAYEPLTPETAKILLEYVEQDLHEQLNDIHSQRS